MKCAVHTGGFTQKIKATNSDLYISTPRTVTANGEDGLRIPKSALKGLRESLARLYPDLGKKPFSGTRFCWYARAHSFSRKSTDSAPYPCIPQVHGLTRRRLGNRHAPGHCEPRARDVRQRTRVQGASARSVAILDPRLNLTTLSAEC